MTSQEKKVIGFLAALCLLGLLRMAFQERPVQTQVPVAAVTPTAGL